MDVRDTVMSLLIALSLLAFVEGSNNCLSKQFELSGCVTGANVNFESLLTDSYRDQLCSDVQPLERCVTQTRDTCPNIAPFRGSKGQAIDAMMAAHANLCGTGGATQSVASSNRPCPGSKRRLGRKLQRCHDPLQMSLTEHQMCGPVQQVVRCMKRKVRNYRSCDWMTDTMANQVLFGAEFFGAIAAVRYC